MLSGRRGSKGRNWRTRGREVGARNRRDSFGVDCRNALQQEVAEFGEGGGFLAGDAALREEAKHLAERAVHARGGGEIAAGGIEFWKIEGVPDDGAAAG